MKTCGIICEYNPFHSGHAYHIAKTKELTGATHTVCVMSASCVQRGDFAIYDKWTRARAAIEGGADLVIELASAKAVASAEKFAFNAVSLLNKMNIIDVLSFGSECGDIGALLETAGAVKKEDFAPALKSALADGLGYHDAYTRALVFCKGNPEIINGANNLLGIEYIKALDKLNSKMVPFTLKREGAAHDENTVFTHPSASYLRARILRGEDAAMSTVHSLSVAENAALALLRSPSIPFSELADVSEGIENRLQKAIVSSTSLSEIYEKAKTKRYSMSRIRRLVLSACLGLTEDLAKCEQNYFRVLALNSKGAELIEQIRKVSQTPVITKLLSDYDDEKSLPPLLAFECKVQNLFNVFSTSVAPCGEELTNSPVFVESAR